MSLTWKDGLASAFVGAAVLLFLLSLGDTSVAGLSGPRALAAAIFALGVAGCYTAKSHMEEVYGVGDGPRPPLLYVVLVSILGVVLLVAGAVAFFGSSAAALATLTGAMVVLWAVATLRHARSYRSLSLLRTTHSS